MVPGVEFDVVPTVHKALHGILSSNSNTSINNIYYDSLALLV